MPHIPLYHIVVLLLYDLITLLVCLPHTLAHARGYTPYRLYFVLPTTYLVVLHILWYLALPVGPVLAIYRKLFITGRLLRICSLALFFWRGGTFLPPPGLVYYNWQTLD